MPPHRVRTKISQHVSAAGKNCDGSDLPAKRIDAEADAEWVRQIHSIPRDAARSGNPAAEDEVGEAMLDSYAQLAVLVRTTPATVAGCAVMLPHLEA